MATATQPKTKALRTTAEKLDAGARTRPKPGANAGQPTMPAQARQHARQLGNIVGRVAKKYGEWNKDCQAEAQIRCADFLLKTFPHAYGGGDST